VTGDLGNAMRHVAAQPEVRAVEEAINPYLEEARDFSDPTSVRAFFARAALPPCTTSRPCRARGEATRWGSCTRRPGMARRRCACSLTWIRRRLEIQTTGASSPFGPRTSPPFPASVRVMEK